MSAAALIQSRHTSTAVAVLGLVLSLLAIVWVGASDHGTVLLRLSSNESQLDDHEVRLRRSEASRTTVERIEVKVDQLTGEVERIRNLLESQPWRPRPSLRAEGGDREARR